MRPRGLVMEGFLAYRQRTEVDFTDADLFVLSGPTGSGKSSVIDGMTFALYGTIPRLDDRRSVAPVISARADRARVAFEFSVGEEVFTVARLVERRGSGATTTEARLERGPGAEPVAAGADEVSGEVMELLGLTYDHFTKAVVLPQGAFAEFLTDKPKDRQTLLRALLDIGLFEQVMQLANLRARNSEGKAQVMRESLEKLEVPSPAHVEAMEESLEAALRAVDQLPGRIQLLSEAEALALEARTARDLAGEALARLESVTPPPDLETLDQDRVAAIERLETAKSSQAALESKGKEIEIELAGCPTLPQLETWQELRARLASLVQERAQLDLAGLAALADASIGDRDAARSKLDRLRIEHAAHELRQGLEAGDTCPVCQTVITSVPVGKGRGHQAVDRAVSDLDRLDKRAAEARDRLKEAEGEAKQIDDRIREIDERLGDAPEPATLQETIAAVKALVAVQIGLERMREAAVAELDEAQSALALLDERASGWREALLAARDRVAGDKPPIPGNDVVISWREFEAWRADRIMQRTSELTGLEEKAAVTEGAATAATAEMRSWLETLGVGSTGSPETDLALAAERRRTEIDEMERTLDYAAELSRELEVESSAARVAATLGTHLRANNFEAWLLEEAMETLVDGANHLLGDLTGGAYSLLSTDSQFEVIDHRNADLTRTTRGLSGGETFLVALSLSLSMAGQLAELTGTTSRLESVFLDEGFGSLDQESLDVVAAVLDELVGRGRTVGIVTHVRELAERIPVRFEVTKGPETASIERVLA